MHDEEAETARVLENHTYERKPRKNPSYITACIDNAFDDKRVTVACIYVWFVICLIGFTWLGIFGSEYMRIGPSPTLTYMGVIIDTMPKYISVVGFVVISTAINDFSSDSLSPFIANTVMDHKSKTIPYSKFTIIFITQAWSLYCGVMSVASIALVFAQFDLILIRLVVDLLVNQYTIRRFLINKAYDPLKYRTEFLNEELEERDFSIDEHDPPTEYKDSCRLSIPLSPSGDNGARFDSRLAEHAARQLRKELDLDELPLDPRVDRAPDDKFIIKPKKKKLNLNEV